MTDKPRDVDSIVLAARQISDGSQRAAYVASACGGDRALRERVERRLAAEEVHNVPSSAETVAAPSGSRGHLSSSAGAAALPSSEKPGAIIGHYTLLQKIGEGGFGAVYLAQQREPVQRSVALKIIKLGMDTHDVIARFEQERQALAVMDHPNIAKVLDAGATDTGRPYFVMEYVKGIPITDYCDNQNMSMRDRLNLFMQVCSAVQHAHQKGIIHRDIKPNNVLVTQLDGKPVPKVIDFGIAKATQQKLTEHTMFTGYGQFMGTPAYMSPEQAEPLGLDIDTRSDIYSLGVMLYELLTGATPFEMKTLRNAALDEVKRIIRENDPPRPSTRLSTLGENLSDVAKMRGVEPRKLGTVLRGDLDWIIMKAIEKDRTRRYESATEFARDIERYLNHEPVTAGPPSVSYRLQKFVRRNRTGVAAAAIALFALIGFAVTMAVQAKRIAEERDRANYEREMSDRVVEFQGDMLRTISPLKLGESIAADLHSRIDAKMSAEGEADEQRQATLGSLDATLGKINLTDTARNILDVNILTPASQAIAKKFANQPQVEGRLQHALSLTYLTLGLPEKALAHSQSALDVQRASLGEEHRDTLRTLSLHAMNLWELDRTRESGEILRKAVPRFEKAFGPEDPDTLHAKMCLAVLDVHKGMGAEARKQYEELLKVQERVLGPEHSDVASTLMNFGIVLINQHLNEQAVPLLERAVTINLKLHGPDDHSTLFAAQKLAAAYAALGRFDDAARLQLDAMQRIERTSGSRHPDTIEAIINLAGLYKAKGDFQKAEPLARKALELNRATVGDSHRDTVNAMTDMGIILGMLGRHAEAEQYHVEAYERTKEALGADHATTMDKLNNLAVHYWYLGQFQKALALFEESLAGMERRYGKDNIETTFAMSNLAIIYTKLARLDEAQAMLDRALAIRTKAYGPNHTSTLETQASLAMLYFEKREWEKAEQAYVELNIARSKLLGPDHPYVFETTYNLALVKEKLGKKEEAEKLLAESLEGRRRVVGANHSETLDSATELARMRFEAGRPEEARPLFAEVIAARREAASADGASAAQLNACALLLLECPAEDLRNPADALKFAEQANVATDNGDPTFLNTLARALFRTGQAEKAAETQKKAIALLPQASPTRAEYEERLAEYATGGKI